MTSRQKKIQFRVTMPNHPGAAATVAAVLSKAGVAVSSLVSSIAGDVAHVRVIAEDESAARRALARRGLPVLEIPVYLNGGSSHESRADQAGK